MIFREAQLSDLEDLLALEQKVIAAEKPFNAAIKNSKTFYYDMKKYIKDNKTYLLVVEKKHEIIATGYAQIRISKESLQHDQHSYLGFMFTAPEYRGQGINKDIIDMLVSWSKKQGVSDFYLDVYAQNTAAIRAYEKCGFKPCLLEMALHT